MNRLAVGFVLASTFFTTYAYAQTQAEIANQENEDGKTMMFASNYKGATDKFRDAATRAPEAKYFFNLCTSLYQQGVFGDALTACNSADKLNPDDKLKAKLSKLEDKIREDATAQHIDLQPTGGGGGPTNIDNGGGTTDPNLGTTGGTPPGPDTGNPGTTGVVGANGGSAPGPIYAVGRPTQNLIEAGKPEHNYTWTLGVDLYGGGGQIGQKDFYGSSAGGVRIKGDYLLNPAAKFGAEAYLQITHLNAGAMQSQDVSTLDVVDLGLALYKHFCPPGAPRLCLTPLIGAHLSLMSPAGMTDGEGSQVFNYAAVGGRAEIAAAYAFGHRYEHVVSLMLGVNVYSPVISSPADGLTASEIGLNAGGAFVYAGLGYTYRFNTPFGRTPFVILE